MVKFRYDAEDAQEVIVLAVQNGILYGSFFSKGDMSALAKELDQDEDRVWKTLTDVDCEWFTPHIMFLRHLCDHTVEDVDWGAFHRITAIYAAEKKSGSLLGVYTFSTVMFMAQALSGVSNYYEAWEHSQLAMRGKQDICWLFCLLLVRFLDYGCFLPDDLLLLADNTEDQGFAMALRKLHKVAGKHGLLISPPTVDIKDHDCRVFYHALYALCIYGLACFDDVGSAQYAFKYLSKLPQEDAAAAAAIYVTYLSLSEGLGHIAPMNAYNIDNVAAIKSLGMSLLEKRQVL